MKRNPTNGMYIWYPFSYFLKFKTSSEWCRACHDYWVYSYTYWAVCVRLVPCKPCSSMQISRLYSFFQIALLNDFGSLALCIRAKSHDLAPCYTDARLSSLVLYTHVAL